jgi:asparagine synthase (glutamine-hydrolysing)
VADVPVGIFLSGGVDSTAVAALSVRHNPDIHAYHITSADNDERIYARMAARHLGIKLEECEIDASSWDHVLTVHSAFGEPFADPAAMNNALLAEAARSQITVALSGDGGDEVFAGYGHIVRERRSQLIRRFTPPAVIPPLAGFLDLLPLCRVGKLARLFREAAVLPPDRFGERDLLLHLGSEIYTQDIATELAGWQSDSNYHKYYNELNSEDSIKRILYADMKMRLVGEFLPRLDVTSMASSLEIRSPFLDREIVELGMCLPTHYLVTPSRAKHILRLLVSKLVPREIIDRPKQGFQFSVLNALRTHWRNNARQLLREERPALSLWLSNSLLKKIVDDAAWHTDDALELAWRLVCLAAWTRTVRHRL